MTTIFSGTNRIEVPYGVYGPASGRGHKGVDIDTLAGQDATVHSTVAGRVEYAGMVPRGGDRTWEWGWHVRVIEDGTGHRHTFAHCRENSLRVKAGERIAAGQALATMGKTGNAEYDRQAEHVHYQVDKRTAAGWMAMNPTPWCGGGNQPGTWPPAGYSADNTNKEEDAVYRLYQVAHAYESKEAAMAMFNTLLQAGKRPGFDYAASAGKYRVGTAVMAVEDPARLFGQLEENYFIG